MNRADEKIEAALDRLEESHRFLHQIEEHYHDAEALRHSMNAFIRSLEEIPDMVLMALNNTHEGFTEWHKPIRRALEIDDPLFSKIKEHRNYIVHRSMLKPTSKAYVASILGDRVKMEFSFYIDPFEDSSLAMQRFIEMSKNNPTLMQTLITDETQTLTLIREWHIEGFDEEIIESFRNAWRRVVSYLSEILAFLGSKGFPPEGLPDCFIDSRNYRYKNFPNFNHEI